MKTLTYIFVIFLVVLASCTGCGSSKSTMSSQNSIVSRPDSVNYLPIRKTTNKIVKSGQKAKPDVKYKVIYDTVSTSLSSEKQVEKNGIHINKINKSNKINAPLEAISGVATNNIEDTTKVNESVNHQLMMTTSSPIIMQSINTSQGTLVYTIDSILTIGVVSRVEARIIKKTGQSTTNQLVQLTTHTTTGVIRTEIIPVGNIMDMNLIALEPDAFTIAKVSSGDQPVDQTTVTEWLWGVTANKIGNHDLILKATINENGTHKDKIVFDKIISVKNKPKKIYSTNFQIPNKLIRYKDNTIELDLKEKELDTSSIEWGGNGTIGLEFIGLKSSDDVIVTKIDDYTITDSKSIYNYKWTVQPKGEEDSLHYVIKITGDYEELVVSDKYIQVNKNWKGWFTIFLEGAAKSWYWVFTALLIPLYHVIKRKYFPEKKIFRRRKKTPSKT